MKRVVQLGVRNPVFVNILLAMILFGGVASWLLMVREVLPAFTFDMVLVQVPYPGADPQEVEEGIAIKLEEAIQGTEGVKNYYTTSREHMAIMRIELVPRSDVQRIKDEITERIRSIPNLPVDAEDPLISEVRIDSRVLSIAVFGDVPERQLKDLAEEIREDLLQEPGISQVSISGARDYEISIEVSEEALQRFGLTLAEVTRLVREASQNYPGGTLRSDGDQIAIRTVDRRYTGQEFANIVLIAGEGGASVRLGDVATVHDGFVDEVIIGRFNGQRTVMVDISKTREEDALKIADTVDRYIARRNATLPPEIRLQKFFDSSRFIDERLALMIENGFVGLCIVFVLLWLFLDLRLAVWCSLGIPISLAGALALMAATGQSINMLSLFALIMILGIIVDDAIVVGESIYHKRQQGLPPRRAAVEGAVEVAMPVAAAVTTTVVAFVPLLFVSGIMGKFIRVLPIAVICALLVSLVESLFMMPAHLRDLTARPLSEEPGNGAVRLLRRLRLKFGHALEWIGNEIYEPIIRRVLNWRYATVAAAFAVLLASWGAYQGGLIKYEMFPEIDTDLVFAQIEFPSGTPVEQTEVALERMRLALDRVAARYEERTGRPLVLGLYSVAGAALGYNQTEVEMGAQLGLLLIELLPAEERLWHFRSFLIEWEEEIGILPGVISMDFEGPQMGPGGNTIEIALLGHNLDDLRAATRQLRDRLSTYEGLYQIEDDFREGRLEVWPRLKPEARNLGLTAADLGMQVRQAFYGDEAMRIQRGRDDLKLWIRLPREQRTSLDDVRNLRIRTRDGREIPISAVADLELRQGFFSITRKNGLRRIVVTARVNKSIVNSNDVVADLNARFFPTLQQQFPTITISTEGEQQENTESLRSLMVGFPLAMLGIYLILATMFRSYIQPVVIMLTIPFGLIGAVLGHMVMSFEVTMLSMFGMVALSGIVVNDAIVLIDGVNVRVRRGVPVFDAIAQGGARRFRAIMLTTLTTSLGLAPLVFEKSVQAQFLIPMALSIAGGLLFATLLTLFLVPCCLLILNDARVLARRLTTGNWPTREEVEPHLIELEEEPVGVPGQAPLPEGD